MQYVIIATQSTRIPEAREPFALQRVFNNPHDVEQFLADEMPQGTEATHVLAFPDHLNPLRPSYTEILDPEDIIARVEEDRRDERENGPQGAALGRPWQ